MTPREAYLFDLQGYLVVPNALSRGEVAALNAVLDAKIAAVAEWGPRRRSFNRLLEWGQPYLELIDHPRLLPYIVALCGERVRLDHEYLDVIQPGSGPVGSNLHGGATPFDPVFYYRYQDGRMHNGLVAVAYNLHDVGPDDGGFGCVPGSHKSNISLPAEWIDLEQAPPFVQRVAGPAGTAIIFTEALTHGTLPWRGAQQRRTIFYKYSPHPLSWFAHYYNADDYPGLTERQRAMLEPPNARYAHRDQHRRA